MEKATAKDLHSDGHSEVRAGKGPALEHPRRDGFGQGPSFLELLEIAGLKVHLASGEAHGGPVSWVVPANLPVPDWLTAGSAIVVPGRALSQLRVPEVKELASSGIVGIAAVGVHRPSRAVEKRLVRAPVPVAWMPGSVAGVTEALGRALAEHDSHRLGIRFHDALPRSTPDLGEIARTLASLLGRSIAFEDNDYRILASWTIDSGVDPVWRMSLEEGRPPDAVLEALDRFGYLRRMRTSRTPLRIPGIEDLKMVDRIVAPVRIGPTLYGFLTILEHEPLSAGLAAAQHAATLAALHFAELDAVVDTEKRLRGTFVDDLLSDMRSEMAEESLYERARLLGLDLASPYCVCIIQARRSDGEVVVPLEISNFGGLLRNALSHEPLGCPQDDSFFRPFGDRIVLLLRPADGDEEDLGTLLAGLAEAIEKQLGRFRCYIGCGTARAGLAGIVESHREAREAVALRHRSPRVLFYRDARRLRLLNHVASTTELQTFVRDVLGVLSDPRTKEHREWKEALVGLARTGYRRSEAAEELFVHRNTLRQRIDRIELITGLDLSSSADHGLVDLALDAEAVVRERSKGWSNWADRPS